MDRADHGGQTLALDGDHRVAALRLEGIGGEGYGGLLPLLVVLDLKVQHAVGLADKRSLRVGDELEHGELVALALIVVDGFDDYSLFGLALGKIYRQVGHVERVRHLVERVKTVARLQHVA